MPTTATRLFALAGDYGLDDLEAAGRAALEVLESDAHGGVD